MIMNTLKIINSGSSGNSYALIDNDNKILLLDLGLPAKEIKKAIDFRISDVVGAVVTHSHQDHSKAAADFEKMGIQIFTPYNIGVFFEGEHEERIHVKYGNFDMSAFALTDLNGKWMHTNADGSECPCYGFLITHPDMGRLLYITDTELIKWRFKDINHILLGVNYDKNMIDNENQSKRNHVFRGHLSIDTACDFVKANNSDALKNVIMCHLSSENADKDLFIEKMKKIVPVANVCVAERGVEIELRNKNECPF